MKINAASRILLFAPHPDDETLAAGGLLQQAVAAGACVHIVLATDGDDNPWPHRVLERQWKIEVADRMLWGMRRAQETLDALEMLGCPRSCTTFLHLPDQSLTELFLRGDAEVVERIATVIEEVQPTHVIAPSAFDLHPDHSALHILVRLALSREEHGAERLYYSVHTRGYHSDWTAATIELTPNEQAVKRLAILCHRSQTALSRKRFLRYARTTETFFRPALPREIDLHHSVRGGRLESDSLLLQLQRRKRSRSFTRCTLLVATERGRASGERWAVQLPRRSRHATITNAATGAEVGRANVFIRGVHAEVRLPILASQGVTQVFAKLEQPSLFFDAAGWRELPAAAAVIPEGASRVSLAPFLRGRKRPARSLRVRAKAVR